MQTFYVPIAQGRSNLCKLIDQVESGAQVVFTSHGKPKAVLSAFNAGQKPWRLPQPDDLSRYGDLQIPVLEDWQ